MTEIMQRKPFFSIIMPAYNAAGYIADAIASVQSQTFADWELLVLDDASTDNTRSVVEAIAQNDARVQYIGLQALRNPGAVRNVGIQKAAGEYLAFLDADDLFETETLALYRKYLETHPEARAVYGQYVEIDPDNKVLRDYYVQNPVNPSWKSLLGTASHHQLQALAVERSLVLDIGGFDEKILFGEDWAFYVELFNRLGENLGMVPECVFRYRIYPVSITRDEKRAWSVLNAIESLGRWLERDAHLPAEAQPYVSLFYSSNYSYFFRTRFQSGQWLVLVTAMARSCFNSRLNAKDWLRSYWAVGKLCLPESLLQLSEKLKSNLRSLKSGFRKPNIVNPV